MNGKRVRESTETDNKRLAETVLKEREGRVATGQPILPRADKILYAEIAQDLRDHYKVTGSRELEEAEYRLKHLDTFFTGWRVARIDASAVDAYVVSRQQQGAANGTINRELGVLGKMLRLAYRHHKLIRLPVFGTKPKEAAPRQGFFERDAFESVRKHLPEYLRPVVTFAYITGWRTRSEVLPLQWRQVDFKAETVRLEPGTTKNDEGRVFHMTPELRTGLEAQREVRDALQKSGRIVPWVFHRKGDQIKGFRKAWATACKKAGQPGRIPHDFRRTAVRNLERAGVPRSVAMKMVGHKTEAIYRRYAIVDEAMLREGAQKLAALSAIQGGQ
jgi:integrase